MNAKRIFLALVITGAMAILVTVVSGWSSLSSAADAGQHLEGTWIVTVTREDGRTFLSLMTFTPNGEVLEETNTSTIRSLSHGEWVRTGDRQFTRTFIYFRFDGPMRKFIGTGRATANMRLSEDLKEFRAVARVERFDAEGKLVDTGSATEIGKRLELNTIPDQPDVP